MEVNMREYNYNGVKITTTLLNARINKNATGFVGTKVFVVHIEGHSVRCRSLKDAKFFVDEVQSGRYKL